MPSIEVKASSITSAKHALLDQCPEIKSSHLSEALAAALGFRTNAALLSALPNLDADPPIEFLQHQLFSQRLKELGYQLSEKKAFAVFSNIGAIATNDDRAQYIEYKSKRDKAWRNLLVCAINAGITQKLFSLRPNDCRWEDHKHKGALFDFLLPNGLPARGYVQDAGFSELAIHVAVNPIDNWVRAFNAGFSAGDAFATSWLERERGAWLQSATTTLSCRNNLLQPLAEIIVEPRGYGDRGRVIN
ncbi:hypothetical protein [Deefgea rivuli]|uniref:hypothetical protein n=1 Tax=Deefgea rivuli TaxID=400948 RepID=UPI000482ADB6|nr:hypothetical protein [Deefgea rivuli]